MPEASLGYRGLAFRVFQDHGLEEDFHVQTLFESCRSGIGGKCLSVKSESLGASSFCLLTLFAVGTLYRILLPGNLRL